MLGNAPGQPVMMTDAMHPTLMAKGETIP